MATTLQLTDGTTTIDLNDMEASFGVADEGMEIGSPEPVAAWGGTSLHYDGSLPLAHRWGNRTIKLTLYAKATSKDTLHARLAGLEALLRSGMAAARCGWGNTLTLQYQQDGASHMTYFDVLAGYVEVTGWASVTYSASNLLTVGLSLVCQPFARGAQVDLPRNVCTNPDFEKGTTEWSAVNGTIAVSTDYAYEGAKSLKLTPGGSAAMRVEYVVPAGGFSPGQPFTFLAPLFVPSGKTPGVCRISVGDDAGGWAHSYSEYATLTGQWQLLSVTRTIRAGAASVLCTIRNESLDTTNVVYYDGLYMWNGVASLNPDNVWLSHYAMQVDDDAADVKHNYLAVKGIPGDQPAATRLRLTNPDASAQAGPHLYCHRWRSVLSNHAQHRECEGATLGGATSSVADATASGGNVARVTGAGSDSYAARCTWSVTSNAASMAGRFRAVLRAKISAGTGYVKLLLQDAAGNTVFTGDEVTTTSTSFVTLDLGLVEIPPWARGRDTAFAFKLVLQTKADTAGRNFDLDWLQLFDAETLIAVTPNTALAQNTAVQVSGLQDDMYPIQRYDVTNARVTAGLWTKADGRPFELQPSVEQRIYVTFEHGDINDSLYADMSYVPRWLKIRE